MNKRDGNLLCKMILDIEAAGHETVSGIVVTEKTLRTIERNPWEAATTVDLVGVKLFGIRVWEHDAMANGSYRLLVIPESERGQRLD